MRYSSRYACVRSSETEQRFRRIAHTGGQGGGGCLGAAVSYPIDIIELPGVLHKIVTKEGHMLIVSKNVPRSYTVLQFYFNSDHYCTGTSVITFVPQVQYSSTRTVQGVIWYNTVNHAR